MATAQPTQHKLIAGRQFLQALLDAGVVTDDERLLEVARKTALEITETTG